MNSSGVSEVLNSFQGELVGAIISLLLAIVLFLFRQRANLLWGGSSISLNRIDFKSDDNPDGGQFEFYVEKYLLQNSGTKPATKVQFVLSYEPSDVNVIPSRAYDIAMLSKGEFQITIGSVAPKETIEVDCFYLNKTAARVLNVRCDECVGKWVPFMSVRQFDNKVYQVIWLLIFFGIAFIAQLIFELFS